MISEIENKVMDIFLNTNCSKEDGGFWVAVLSKVNGWKEMYEWLQKQEKISIEMIDNKIEEMLLRK